MFLSRTNSVTLSICMSTSPRFVAWWTRDGSVGWSEHSFRCLEIFFKVLLSCSTFVVFLIHHLHEPIDPLAFSQDNPSPPPMVSVWSATWPCCCCCC